MLLAKRNRFVFTAVLLLAPSVPQAQDAPATWNPNPGGFPDRGPVATGDDSSVSLPVTTAVGDMWVDEVGDTMTGTLVLDPPGAIALDVRSGSIYKNGALFIHNQGGNLPYQHGHWL